MATSSKRNALDFVSGAAQCKLESTRALSQALLMGQSQILSLI